MTFAPPTLLEVRSYLKGLDADLDNSEVGIVGGPSHIRQGTSYHLGADQLIMSKNPYSARTSRDRAGLSNAASALDIDDDLNDLRALSIWLVNQCRAGAIDTFDIREIIYSPDGVNVYRWDRERGQNSAPIPDADLSHRNHTHVSYYRDSEFRSKVGLYQRFYEGDDEMEQTDTLAVGNNTNFPHRTLGHAWADVANLRDWWIGSGVAFPPDPAGYPKPGSPADLVARLPEVIAQNSGTVDVAALAQALVPLLLPHLKAVVREELDNTRLGEL